MLSGLPVIATVVLLLLLLVQVFSSGTDNGSKNSDKTRTRQGLFLTNQAFIEGLYYNLDLKNAKKVFQYIFFNLENEVVIYPTENYYYFRFFAQGKTIWGSLSFFPQDRDKGVIDFGYSEHNEDPNKPDSPIRAGGSGSYSEKDGLTMKKINDFKYAVTFEGRTVIFKLNDVGMSQPKSARLLEEEEFVGPVFDESGLKFFLIFNKEKSRLYFILNEDGFVPEYFQNLTRDIVIGNRTGFAFYIDKENNRKILIGVQGENVLKNNWYDGPFDQMPDNYIYTGQIPKYQKYIEANYPGIKGKIDKYGNYLDETVSRVAVAPYLVYFSKQDLIATVERCKPSDLSRPTFYSCITMQVYDIPKDKHYLIPTIPSRTSIPGFESPLEQKKIGEAAITGEVIEEPKREKK